MSSKERFVYVLPITKVEERKLRRHVKGIGKDAEFTTNESLGWFVTSGLMTFPLGADKPADLVEGGMMRVTVEAETSASSAG